MKKIVTVTIVGAMVLQAVAQQKQSKKPKANAVAEFPKEMAAPVRAEYIKMWEKGRILYELNCADCHNKVVGKVAIIPEFSAEALRGYELRVLNAEHEQDMPDEKVTAEELVLISTFLTYKKKNAPAS